MIFHLNCIDKTLVSLYIVCEINLYKTTTHVMYMYLCFACLCIIMYYLNPYNFLSDNSKVSNSSYTCYYCNVHVNVHMYMYIVRSCSVITVVCIC